MKFSACSLLVLLFSYASFAQKSVSVKSPDQKIDLTVNLKNGMLSYALSYGDGEFLGSSPLGLVSSIGDFSKDLQLVAHHNKKVSEQYTLNKSKVSKVNYQANELRCVVTNGSRDTMSVIFRVSDKDVAFQYLIHQNGKGAVIYLKKF